MSEPAEVGWLTGSGSGRRRAAGILLLAFTLAAVGLAAPASFLADLVGAGCILAIMVLSWTVFCGPSREISFGQAFFVGGAGYLAGLLQVRCGLPPWTALLAGVVGGALLGFLVAVLTLRHRGLYFSMVTMALQLAAYHALFLRSSLFGGEEGVLGIQTLAVTRAGLYAVAAAGLIAACVAVDAFLHSRWGLLLGATGQNEELAQSLGVNVPRLRLYGLALSGAVAGLGGALYVLTQGQANAELASEAISARIVLAGIVGGLWSLPGALVTAFGLQALQAWLFRAVSVDALIYTSVLLALALLLPRGIVPIRPHWGLSRPGRPTGSAVAGGSEPAAAASLTTGSAAESPASQEGLVVSGLVLRFGGVRALDGVSLEARRGDAIGLIGPNGAGKSSLLNAIAGNLPGDARGATAVSQAQEVRWAGRSLRGLDAAARARLGVRKTFQQVMSFPDLTLAEHLEVSRVSCAGRAAAGDPALARLIAAGGGDATARTPLGLLPPAAARLAEIAMAVAAPPELLLVDEPFAALSGEEVEAVCAGLETLHRRGVTLVIVEHRLHELFRLVDRVLVMDRGRIIAVKPPAEVLLDPVVQQVYGIVERGDAA
ncbi:MAG TPA: ATP-binding cassette domain-containing protein [Thermoanaerobaculia bacterium]|nr:ATP-binding cassette domain-containing protein [Thermoanaerobaculia bacterium]